MGIRCGDALVRKGLCPLPLPAIPGFVPGDRAACFFAKGAYAISTLVPAEALLRLPDDITTEAAATFLAKGLTAWMGLRAMHPL